MSDPTENPEERGNGTAARRRRTSGTGLLAQSGTPRSARLRARGVGWEEVARRLGLSVRQAQRARLNHIQRAAMYAAMPEDPNAVLHEAVQHHRAALEECRAAAAQDQASHG